MTSDQSDLQSTLVAELYSKFSIDDIRLYDGLRNALFKGKLFHDGMIYENPTKSSHFDDNATFSSSPNVFSLSVHAFTLTSLFT